ncbi:unnamed protein product [Lota lota]
MNGRHWSGLKRNALKLEKSFIHRFPYFKQTELYHYFSLCKELLQVPSSCQLKGRVQYSLADRWLLKRCLGSVQGMRRFCSFLKGTRGEDLVTFCVRVDQLHHIDWRRNPGQRTRYQAIYAVIKAFHLTEGSNIMAACRLTPAMLCEIARSQPGDGMREPILTQMRQNALNSLQSYWLPRFLWVCKKGITVTGDCFSIAKEYEDVASDVPLHQTEPGPPPDPSIWSLRSKATEGGPTVARTYSSRLRKASLFRSHQRPGSGLSLGAAEKPDCHGLLMWSPLEDAEDDRKCNNVAHQSKRGETVHQDVHAVGVSRELRGVKLGINASSVAMGNRATLPSIFKHGGLGKDMAPYSCINTPIFHLPSIMTTGHAPRPPPPWPLSTACPSACDDPLSIGLSADAVAGRPYEDFLRVQGEDAELHHLGLWQELDNFLNLLLMVEDSSSIALRQTLAQRIVTMYLVPGHQQGCSLSENTATNLVKCLLFGNTVTWIYTAKQELCQILASTFYRFLEEEDKCFLTHLFNSPTVSGKVSCWCTATPDGPDVPVQQVRRIREALALSQTYCCYTAVGPLNEETWALLPLEDVRRGGSIHLDYKRYEKGIFYVLALHQLELSVSHIIPRRTDAQYGSHYSEENEFDSKAIRETKVRHFEAYSGYYVQKRESIEISWELFPHRNFKDVLRNRDTLEHFVSFLKQFHAYRDLQFYQAVEKLWIKQGEQGVQQASIDKIFIRFFKQADPAKSLQCNAPFMSGISQMRRVSVEVLHTVQWLVARSLEIIWFRQYQNTFPERHKSTDTIKRVSCQHLLIKHAWKALSRLIRSICQFRRAMRNSDTRSSLEAYLVRRWADYSTSTDPVENTSTCADGVDSTNLRTRLVNKKLVAVNLLVNDLSFYLETDNFRKLAYSADRIASEGLLGEKDYSLLQLKADVIVDSIFCAEMADQLRINIVKDMWLSIRRSFLAGRVDGSLFSDAIFAVFPTLLYCWKKVVPAQGALRPHSATTTVLAPPDPR